MRKSEAKWKSEEIQSPRCSKVTFLSVLKKKKTKNAAKHLNIVLLKLLQARWVGKKTKMFVCEEIVNGKV